MEKTVTRDALMRDLILSKKMEIFPMVLLPAEGER
jgi:hypothetical protein